MPKMIGGQDLECCHRSPIAFPRRPRRLVPPRSDATRCTTVTGCRWTWLSGCVWLLSLLMDAVCLPQSMLYALLSYSNGYPGTRNPAADCTLFGGSLRKSPKCCKALYPFNLRKEARKDAGQKQGVFRSINVAKLRWCRDG